MTGKQRLKGGEPTGFAKCIDCRSIYLVQEKTDGVYRPIGMANGSCSCGNGEFEPLF